MLFTTDPPIIEKIQRMQDRVRWQQTAVLERNIDQTQLWIDDGQAETESFSFMVLGDSGTGRYRGDSPQRRVAEALLAYGEDARFTLHTGDVVYLVGSSEQYFENFIEPYREHLVGGHAPRQITYDQMVFQRPIFPTLGNHDYYDLPIISGIASVVTRPLRRLLQTYVDVDLGWHGSYTGDAFARAFIDYLRGVNEAQLAAHLDQHYTAKSPVGKRCLRYVPGEFTRLPNRYYSFRYGGIDFFALDSNTFNTPRPIADNAEGQQRRQQLENSLQQLRARQKQCLDEIAHYQHAETADESLTDLSAEAEQVAEQIRDIEKQLDTVSQLNTVDLDQLNWLRDRIFASWQDPQARGRIVFFHHPPYVTETTKWPQGQTLAVRRNLRSVLTAVEGQIGRQTRPLVDLVINGHAHCMEHLQTGDNGLADARVNYIVCGGSGYSLRRQRTNGPTLQEAVGTEIQPVAHSQRYIGRAGHGSEKQRPYSCLRVEVKAGNPPQFVAIPVIAEKKHYEWKTYADKPFELR
ncbi:MAG: metallophosphoesterase [Cyanobacteria bacterium P01_D01_bin.14]